MGDYDIETSQLHSELECLKKLEQFTFESKMLCSQRYSSRLMDGSKIDFERAMDEGIMPWEIEIFTAYSVIYNNDEATDELDENTFREMIEYIRTYWDLVWDDLEKSGEYADCFVIRAAIQQFSVQGIFLPKLFRYNYFFNFCNQHIDMRQAFLDEFKVDYSSFANTAFMVYVALSHTTLSNSSEVILDKAFENNIVLSQLSISKNDYVEHMQELYNSDIIQMYYGLKAHDWWPFIDGENYRYIPAPYLVINAVTDSMLNRLTLKNNRLRNEFGKEVLESYLYDIYKQVDTVSWISSEIDYKIGRKSYKTSDVLVGEDGYCIFFDTKAQVPSLKIRNLDAKEIEKDIIIYAKAIIQIYHQIKNYLSGHYELEQQYERDNLFGVVVMLETVAFSRSKMYTKVFELLTEGGELISIEEQNYIHSHIKIVSLRDIESLVLENNSFLTPLLVQSKDFSTWDNLVFESPCENNGFIPLYEEYVSNIKFSIEMLLKE